LSEVGELVEGVIEQTRRRVFEGEQLPAQEKLVSIFEEHTRIIRRGKSGKATEFGRKVWLSEVEGGIISDYRILEGNPKDESQVSCPAWRPMSSSSGAHRGSWPGIGGRIRRPTKRRRESEG
jgi:hypothetical protein